MGGVVTPVTVVFTEFMPRSTLFQSCTMQSMPWSVRLREQSIARQIMVLQLLVVLVLVLAALALATLDARSDADRQLAHDFLEAAFATDPRDHEHALARRMGIMYVIWSDNFYPAYHQFQPASYLSSSCRSKRKCSKTLRHRDHMHISLSRAGGRGETSFYLTRQ